VLGGAGAGSSGALGGAAVPGGVGVLGGAGVPSGGGVLGGAEAEAALREALPRTKLYWDRTQPTFNGSLFMLVDGRPDPTLAGRVALDDGVPAVWMGVWTDTHLFALDQVEALVREMEAVVVQAAIGGPAFP
jgi:hypothetical protein